MMVMKCANCGADLELADNMKIAYCMYCGAKVTLFDSDSEMKAIEMANKIDFILKNGKNQQIEPKDRDFAYSTAETLIKLYPSDYLGFLKMAQIGMLTEEPLVGDYGSGADYRYFVRYSSIADNLRQAKVLASENQMLEINAVERELEQRVACEKKKYDEKHTYIDKQIRMLFRDYPQVLHGMRIVSVNMPPIPRGVTRLFYANDRNKILFDSSLSYCAGVAGYAGCLYYYKERLFFCSNSIRRMSFFESLSKGDGMICRMYEVHVNEKGYIMDNHNNRLTIEGKEFRIEFDNYIYDWNDPDWVSLTWKGFWGNEEKKVTTRIERRFFREKFGE